MKLTESQRRAIEARGSDLLLAASAGSGKTEVLARRCVSLICDPVNPCGVEELLVVTFTRAAAAELRQRIVRELRRAARETGDARLRQHLMSQLPLVDAADIGTIDAWCARLVRGNFASAGIDPAFRVLGADEAAVLRGRVLRELFVEMYASEDEVSRAAREWVSRATSASDDFLRGMVTRLNGFRDHLIDPEAWLAARRRETEGTAAELRRAARARLAPALARECRFQAEQIEQLFAQQAGLRGVKPLANYAAALRAWAETLSDAGKLETVVDDIAEVKFRKPPGLASELAAWYDEIKERWHEKRLEKRWNAAEVRAALEHAPLTAEWQRTLLALEERYEKRLRAEKARLAVMEFGDVLRSALNLLGTPAGDGPCAPTEVARRLQRRYAHVLIDEYQDTSPVQAEILRLAARGAEGNRFMVGDLKQSIYGFRQAEPRQVARLMREMASGTAAGELHFLSDNFRSHGRVLAGLNASFAQLFSLELGGSEYAEQERLRTARTEIENATLPGARIELHLLDTDKPEREDVEEEPEEDVEALERIECEALLTAQRIRELMRSGIQVPEKTTEGGLRLRPLKLSDIVILLRAARGNAAAVAALLRDEGVPCAAGGKDELLSCIEVNDVLNALTLIANRRQALPLAAFLRGPFGGLSAEELRTIREFTPKGDFARAAERYAREGPLAGLTEKLRAAFALLERWAVDDRELELPALLRKIVSHDGFLLMVEGLRGGPHRANLIHALHEMACAFAKGGGRGAGEFARFVEELSGQDSPPTVTPAVAEEVVRVMTIHAAKGLEFPIVFLLNCGARFNRRSMTAALQCDVELGIGLRFEDYQTRGRRASPLYNLIRCAATDRDLEEELRLLYVATTRAREKLFVFGHCKRDRWDALVQRYGSGRGAPPLMARLSAGYLLEWVMMSFAAARAHAPGPDGEALADVRRRDGDELVRAARVRAGPSTDADEIPAVAPADVTESEMHWLRDALAAIRGVSHTVAAGLPAVLSVSALKNLAQQNSGPVRGAASHVPSLSRPAFCAPQASPPSVEIGVALHKLLQHMNPAALDDAERLRDEMERLQSLGILSEAEAALLPREDLVWFGATPAGRMLAESGASLRRETPFVFTVEVGNGEKMLVRGIIDALIETPDGLVLLDYKSDVPRDKADFDQRVGIYGLQLQLYAQAAAAIFKRPVAARTLAFVRARQIVQAPAQPPDIGALLQAGAAERET